MRMIQYCSDSYNKPKIQHFMQSGQTLLLSYFSYFLAFSPTFLLLFGISSYSPTFQHFIFLLLLLFGIFSYFSPTFRHFLLLSYFLVKIPTFSLKLTVRIVSKNVNHEKFRLRRAPCRYYYTKNYEQWNIIMGTDGNHLL